MIRWIASAVICLSLGTFAATKAETLVIAGVDDAIRIAPDGAGAYYDRGLAFARNGDAKRAIANFDKAIALYPDDADAYFDRGLAFARLGDHRRAIADFSRAIEFDPGHAVPYANRGYAYYQIGAYDRAIADFDRAIGRDPDLASIHNNRGLAHDAIGKTGRAIADFSKAIERDPDFTSAYRSRGRVLFNRGAFEAAISDLRRIAQRGDAYMMLWLFLAQSKTSTDAAIELADNAAMLTSRAWPYAIVDLYLGKRSANDILASTENADQRCEAQFYVGEWHLIEGREGEALLLLRSAIETCPKTFIEYSGARAELARIE